MLYSISKHRDFRYISTRTIWDDIWRGHWYSDRDRRLRRAQSKLDAVEARYGFLKANAVVCQIGCGAGYFLSGLAARNPRIRQAVGCDHSQAALESASSNFGRDNRLRFVACDAVSLPFPTNAFDAGFAICALEHVHDARSAIKELSRILKPNADLVVFFSNRYSLFTWERRIRSLIGKWPYSFQQETTLGNLQELLVPDFNPIDWCVVTGESDFPCLRRLDSFVHKINKSWGRYIYLHATRNNYNA
jgi:SAM-dependent methyltransferase